MLFVSDQTLTVQAIFAKLPSVQWKTKYNDVGTFEIHISSNSQNLNALKNYCFVEYKGHSGVIMQRSDTGKDVSITGFDLNKLLTYRTVYGNKTGYLETVVKEYVREAFCANDSRKIENFVIAPDRRRGGVISWTHDKLSLALNTVKSICALENFGFAVTLDENNRFVFDLVEPRDRTADIVFSRDFKNTVENSYTENVSNEINTARYLLETTVIEDGEEKKNVSVSEYNPKRMRGLSRREGIADNNADTDKAASFIAANAKEEFVSAVANQKLIYGTDYQLGDYVTVCVSAFGENITLEKQITEVKEVWESNKNAVEPTFGNKTI